MDFLILIKNGCDNLTATAAPSVDSLGLHIVLSLATIMMVWFGVQEALASAQPNRQGCAGFGPATASRQRTSRARGLALTDESHLNFSVAPAEAGVQGGQVRR